MSEHIANATILVPAEPTEDMMAAGLSGALDIALGGSTEEGLKEIWAAMVEEGQVSGETPKTPDLLCKSDPPHPQVP